MCLLQNFIGKGLVCRKKSKKSFRYLATNSLQYKSLSGCFAFSYDDIDYASQVYVKTIDTRESSILYKAWVARITSLENTVV